jgi:hypothetical protein
MLSVPYFERALYDLLEEEVTAERVLALANEIEVGAAAAPMMARHVMAGNARSGCVAC